MTRVAVLGLGLMGSELARNLLSKGNEVHGFNRTQEKAKPLIEKGLVPHSTPSEAVENVNVVITMLSDQDAVSEVAFGANGFLGCIRPGSLWVDMSTILPETSIVHANECDAKGVETRRASDRRASPCVQRRAIGYRGRKARSLRETRGVSGKFWQSYLRWTIRIWAQHEVGI